MIRSNFSSGLKYYIYPMQCLLLQSPLAVQCWDLALSQIFLQTSATAVLSKYVFFIFFFSVVSVGFFCLFLLYNRNIPSVPAETLFSPLEITFFSFQYLAVSGNTCSSGKQMGCNLMGHSGSGKLNLYTTIFLPCYVKWLSNSIIIILMPVPS